MQTRREVPEFQRKLANQFRSLHKPGNFFVLPNAWDVASARMFEEAGFTSVATSSAGMFVSLGYQDGESIPMEEFAASARRMARILSIPLSVDMVSGFGRSNEEVVASVRKVIEAGAVGINIEDFDHVENKLYDPEGQGDRIRAIRNLAEDMGIPLIINARTDAVSKRNKLDLKTALENAISRSEMYKEAGADCVYPMGVVDSDSISLFIKSIRSPVNVMIRKGLPELKVLKQLGVTRVSFGPAASYAAMGLLWRIGKDILERGSFDMLLDGAISHEMLNSLAAKRKQE